MKIIEKLRVTGLVCVCCLALVLSAGCVQTEFDKSECSSKSKVNVDSSIGADLAQAAASDKQEEAKDEWVYKSSNKNDPFVLFEVNPDEKIDEDEFAIEQMELMGTIVAKERVESVAFLKLPNGKDMMVREGQRIGRREGVIKEIRKDSIIVEEVYVEQLPSKEDGKPRFKVTYHRKKVPLINVIE